MEDRPPAEAELVSRARRGDAAAFGTLVFAVTIGPVVQVSMARLSLPHRAPLIPKVTQTAR